MKTSLGANRQRGAVLIIALVVLVAMTLSALALIRSVNMSNRVSGNMAFRESAVLSAEHGTEDALAQLKAKSGLGKTELHENIEDMGYQAALADPAIPEGGSQVDWGLFWKEGSDDYIKARVVNTDAAGNTVSYVIHRLCKTAGKPAEAKCARPPMGGGGDSHIGGGMPLPLSSQVYYRIISRVAGPRNTVAYTQAIVAM